MPSSSKNASAEKRLFRKRSKCPQKVAERIVRAKKEKMYVVKQRLRSKQFDFKIAGSTGNMYDVTIGRMPCCSCPDYQKREDACKHTLFVLIKIIGLDADDELVYQRAFVTEEVNTLFEEMSYNEAKASKYYLVGADDSNDGLDGLIHKFSQTEIEDDGRRYKYRNIRELTGQPSQRDKSTYRPYHWERPGYYGNSYGY